MTDYVDMIEFHANASPEKPAILFGGSAATYGMLHAGIVTAHARMRSLGFKPGQTVAVRMSNPLGHLALMAALHRMGIASLSVERAQLDLLGGIVLDAILAEEPIATLAAAGTRVIVVDDSWFKTPAPAGEQAQAAPPRLPRAEVAPDALCRLIMSSGTTGLPKTIALSFQAVEERLLTYSLRVSNPGWERLIAMLGLSTNFGYSFVVTTFWLGRAIGFAEDASVRQMILGHQADLLLASTHQISVLARRQDEHLLRLDSLKAVHIGGSIAYAPLVTKIRLLVCNNLICGYGSTEGGTVAYSPSDPIHGMDYAVGIVPPWIDVRLTDDAQNDVAPGTPGEVWIKGMSQGRRYHRTADAGYRVDDSEWFRPGDRGVVYRNGLLLITGRLNEIINRGGVKIAPDAIEEEMRKHPVIADAAAIGVMDPLGIEQIWVAVVAHGQRDVDEGVLYEWCTENMPSYSPDRIFVLDKVPRNQLGKVSRESLKEQLKALDAAQTGR